MYQSEFELGHVALYVNDLEKQSLFYQHAIGLHVISEQSEYIDLGVGSTVLVRLLPTTITKPVHLTYGLYHLAILLPNRKALGDCFKHLIDNKVPLQGASDHGYSEAIYLVDLEGNGIEIYCDKPFLQWDIREDGSIIGITEAMDATGVYALGQKVEGYKMSEGTIMGHVHLSVKDSKSSSVLYQKFLNMSDKFSVPSASWIASGQYHHHYAVNEWGGKHLEKREDKLPGLAYSTVIYTNESYYNEAISRVQRLGLNVHKKPDYLAVTDNDGITTHLVLKR